MHNSRCNNPTFVSRPKERMHHHQEQQKRSQRRRHVAKLPISCRRWQTGRRSFVSFDSNPRLTVCTLSTTSIESKFSIGPSDASRPLGENGYARPAVLHLDLQRKVRVSSESIISLLTAYFYWTFQPHPLTERAGKSGYQKMQYAPYFVGSVIGASSGWTKSPLGSETHAAVTPACGMGLPGVSILVFSVSNELAIPNFVLVESGAAKPAKATSLKTSDGQPTRENLEGQPKQF